MRSGVASNLNDATLPGRLRTEVARQRVIPARRAITSRDGHACLHLVICGIVARCRSLAGGRRQITALYLPGDLCDLSDYLAGRSLADLVALTACTLGEIPREALLDARAPRSDWRDTVFSALAREEAIATEWIVSLSQRSAYEAAAHLICELWARLDVVGLTDEAHFLLGVTQVDIADMLGMTPIHVNRTLRLLRENGLVTIRGKCATILDPVALVRAADFDPTYLQLPDPVTERADGRTLMTTRQSYRRPPRAQPGPDLSMQTL